MQYKGKLFGKIGAKYFDTGKTADDWDELEKFKEDYKSFDISVLSKKDNFSEEKIKSVLNEKLEEHIGQPLRGILIESILDSIKNKSNG